MRRAHVSTLAVLLAVPALAACDSAPKEEPNKEAKADEPKQDEAKAEEAPKKKGLAPDAVELPWMREDVLGAIKAGTKMTYELSGKDGKGKDVSDTYECVVKKADDAGAGVACSRVDNPAKGEGQLATLPWTKFSPTFALEKPEHTLVERTKVTVPAGEFDTVVVELKDFFQNTRKVWMVVDKPGVYAQVVDMGNTGAEDDKTELTYKLKAITTP